MAFDGGDTVDVDPALCLAPLPRHALGRIVDVQRELAMADVWGNASYTPSQTSLDTIRA